MSQRQKLRVVFMGTPDFAIPAFQAIVKAGHSLVAVYTRPPSPSGRGHRIHKSSIHEQADLWGIPVYTPTSLKKSLEDQKIFSDHAADVAIVAAYGLILPPAVLSAPRYGCLNIHASLLPRWRGASPIQHALLSGDHKTGVTIMQMEEGLDTGPIISTKEMDVSEGMTAPVLQTQLSQMGAELIVSVLEQLARGECLVSMPQPDAGVTYAPILRKEDGYIDWNNTATEIFLKINAFDPWPGVWGHLSDGSRVRIFVAVPENMDKRHERSAGTVLDREGHIACGDGSIIHIKEIQSPNGKRMSFSDFVNGGYIQVGKCFI